MPIGEKKKPVVANEWLVDRYKKNPNGNKGVEKCYISVFLYVYEWSSLNATWPKHWIKQSVFLTHFIYRVFFLLTVSLSRYFSVSPSAFKLKTNLSSANYTHWCNADLHDMNQWLTLSTPYKHQNKQQQQKISNEF